MDDIRYPSSAAKAASAADDAADRFAQGAHTIVDQAVDQAGSLAEKLHSGVSNAATAIQSRARELRALRENLLTDTRQCVRDHPLAMLGIAFAAGILMRRLTER